MIEPRRPVTIIVLCWNRWALTARCLQTLRANTDLSDVEVIAVDNGSSDATPAELAALSWVRVIRNERNLGFVRGNNVGIRAADPASDVLLLNNDIEIPEPGWLDRLRRSAHASADVGVVGCRLVLPDGRLLHAGTVILPETCWGQQIGALEPDVGQYAVDRDVQGVVFACAYLRREAITKVGLLSEDYESYFEDTDYCLRVRQAGLRVVYCGGTTLVHAQHGSTQAEGEGEPRIAGTPLSLGDAQHGSTQAEAEGGAPPVEGADTSGRSVEAAGTRQREKGGPSAFSALNNPGAEDSATQTSQTFEQIFGRSRRTFRKHWAKELEQAYQHRLAWQSILNFPTGYAMSSRALLRELDQQGVRMGYRYVYGPRTPFPVAESPDTGDYVLNVIAGRGIGLRPRVSVVYGQGDVFRRSRGRYKIGYTMLEVDGFPESWVAQANALDEVWVPTRFNVEGFEGSGLRRPVKIMPLGVDTDHFHPGIRAHRHPDGDFVFLANFEWGERKAPEMLLEVFNRTFRRDEPVVLVCKTINRDGAVNVEQRIRALRLRAAGGRIGFIHNREFAYCEIGALYRSADCFVSAGRGEGWDMPLLEAMACGLPTIATDWGAHRDFAHDDIGYPLAIRGTVPATNVRCPYYEGFSWADPDAEHLAVLLRRVFEQRDEAAEKGRRAAVEVAARWSWRAAAERIRERLVEIGA